jgi:hypothetical protein
MAWHIDPEVEQALIALNDALCTFERGTGRKYTLVLVPHDPKEPCHISLSGKPLPQDSTILPHDAVRVALEERADQVSARIK